MNDTDLKVVQFTGDEYVKVGEAAKPFWERGVSDNPPKLVIFMGGIGAGKTTLRREQFATGYVHFDYGGIASNEILDFFIDTLGSAMYNKAIQDTRDILKKEIEEK